LEDNWRISNRNIISFEDMEDMNSGIERGEEEEFDEDGNPIKRRETDPKKPEYYTQDLPMTPGAIDTSNMLIAHAMYNAGVIYFDQLSDLKRSCEMFHKLIQRFPEHDLVLPCHFLLWTNYTKLRNIPKAEEAKNVILTKYPDTDYAKLILDPDYYKKMEDAAKENERNYELLYGAYNSKHWARTVQLADELLTQSKDVALTSKTAYLRAVAIGQIHDRDALKNALLQVISDYPREEVAELAKIYLSTLTTDSQILKELIGTSAAPTETVSEIEESPFNPNLNEQHYVIILVDVHSRNVNDVKYDVSTFNATFFSLERFNINSFYIDQHEQMVTVARFKNKGDAMNYYIALTTNDVFASGIKEKTLTVYPISASNYSIYYQKANARRSYKKFVEEHYL
jgi:hypothetical protein